MQNEELERLLKQAVDAKDKEERERLEAERKALEEKRQKQEEERRRQEEERRRIEEQQRIDAEKREQLKRQGTCRMNFEWLKVCFVFVMRLSCAAVLMCRLQRPGGGWICAGGSHTMN